MRLARTTTYGLAIVAVALVVLALSGCGSNGDGDTPALDPLIEPPVIAEAGVLRTGVDLSLPPFAADVDGETVGLDVDVAAAVAERLGLTLALVDIGPDDYVQALNDGEIDIALGAISITDSVLADVSFAGSYAENGSAYFSATETTQTVQALAGKRVGAQEGSEAFWTLQAMYGESFVTGYPTLREAMAAAAEGELDLVAGDAMIGAYIGRDFPSVRYVAPIADPVPLGVAVAKDANELETAVRDVLDALAADGVLDAIHAKWISALPAPAAGSEDASPAAE